MCVMSIFLKLNYISLCIKKEYKANTLKNQNLKNKEIHLLK